MRLAAFVLAMLFIGTPLLACEVQGPFPWDTEDYCSDKAQALMTRIGNCLGKAGEDAVSKKQKAALAQSWKDLRCDYVVCDYAASAKPDHEAVADYIDRHFTDEQEFKLTFPPKSCGTPASAKKKPVKKPPAALKKPAAPEKKIEAPKKPAAPAPKPATKKEPAKKEPAKKEFAKKSTVKKTEPAKKKITKPAPAKKTDQTKKPIPQPNPTKTE